jgi:hypothetical protein
MPGIDPITIRQAIAQFKPRRRARFHNLMPWRNDILTLREMGASCEAIAELLTQHGVRTSRTMVTEYLLTLSATKRDRRRKLRLQPIQSLPARAPIQSNSPPPATTPTREPEIPTDEGTVGKSRGPRIAKVELLTPDEKYE